nr:MAG TPA: hypothetical protein [Caudoviricetes sp.]
MPWICFMKNTSLCWLRRIPRAGSAMRAASAAVVRCGSREPEGADSVLRWLLRILH